MAKAGFQIGDTLRVISESAAKGLCVTIPKGNGVNVVCHPDRAGSVIASNMFGQVTVRTTGWAFGPPDDFEVVIHGDGIAALTDG